VKSLQLCWIDESGRQALTVIWMPDDVTTVTDSRVDDAVAALQAASYAQIFSVSLVTPSFPSGSPDTGPFDCLDYAQLSFTVASVDGEASQVSIPAPRVDLFSADLVDIDATLVSGIASALAGFALSGEGFELAALESGYRTRYDR